MRAPQLAGVGCLLVAGLRSADQHHALAGQRGLDAGGERRRVDAADDQDERPVYSSHSVSNRGCRWMSICRSGPSPEL